MIFSKMRAMLFQSAHCMEADERTREEMYDFFDGSDEFVVAVVIDDVENLEFNNGVRKDVQEGRFQVETVRSYL